MRLSASWMARPWWWSVYPRDTPTRILNIIIQAGIFRDYRNTCFWRPKCFGKAIPQIMTLQILSGNGALQIMPFWKLGGKCQFFLRFCTRKRSKTYEFPTYIRLDKYINLKLHFLKLIFAKQNLVGFSIWNMWVKFYSHKIKESCDWIKLGGGRGRRLISIIMFVRQPFFKKSFRGRGCTATLYRMEKKPVHIIFAIYHRLRRKQQQLERFNMQGLTNFIVSHINICCINKDHT